MAVFFLHFDVTFRRYFVYPPGLLFRTWALLIKRAVLCRYRTDGQIPHWKYVNSGLTELCNFITAYLDYLTVP